VIRIKSLEESLRRKTGAWRATIGAASVWAATITSLAITTGAARRRWAVWAASFTVVSPATSWTIGAGETAATIAWTAATIAAWAAKATVAIAWAASVGTSSARPTSIRTLGGEFFPDRHAKFHQLVAIECAIFIVIKELEQLLFDFRIKLMARWRVAIFRQILRRLSQRRDC
jgi:hypothetical protein